MSDGPSLPAGRGELARDLGLLGIVRGDALLVHAALGAVGPVIGGARSLIEALLDAVGPEGLIAMPAFSDDALLPGIGRDVPLALLPSLDARVPGFDVALSAVSDGEVAETFRTWPGVHRSGHPVCSVAALGAGAAEVTARHPRDWPLGPDGPMGRLIERPETKVLMIGTGWERCAALRTAETMARHRRLTVLRFKDVSTNPARWVHARDTASDDGRLFPTVGGAFDAKGSVRHGSVGQAEARVFPLCDLIAFAAPRIAALNAPAACMRGDPPTPAPAAPPKPRLTARPPAPPGSAEH